MKRGNDIKVKFRRQWLLAVGILLLLGVYMSKIIIEDHMHGRLSAENSGQGAVFTLELPRSGGGASHA